MYFSESTLETVHLYLEEYIIDVMTEGDMIS